MLMMLASTWDLNIEHGDFFAQLTVQKDGSSLPLDLRHAFLLLKSHEITTRPGYVKIAIEHGHRNSEFSH